MIIRSDFLTEGLFAQVFVYMLEVLPYIESQGWKPRWEIRTKHYGEPPDFNIFPGIIQTNYTPEPGHEIISFEELYRNHRVNLRSDYRRANRLWTSYFRFTHDVYDRLESFWQANLSADTVLGVHYRGTDKNMDRAQTNPVSFYEFIYIIEDFLKTHADVTAIFVATDKARSSSRP